MSVRRLSRFALVLASVALAACSSPPLAPAPAPEDGVAASPRRERVVVAPLNVPVRAPAELEGKGGPVWDALLSYFQQRDGQLAVLSPISAERLWLEATLDLDLSDRSAALQAGYSGFARALAPHRDFDVLVVPSLVLRPAQLSGWHAAWDGVQRPVPGAPTLGPNGMLDVTGVSPFQLVGLRGKVAAVSLHVMILAPDGTRLYEGLGGLDVLQEAHRDLDDDDRLRFEVREQPFADAKALRVGVARTFDGPMLAAAPAR